MKSLLTVFVLCLPHFLAAQDDFRIQGKVDQLQDGDKIYLVYQVEDQDISDSTTVQDGRFTFSGKLEYPVFSSLFLHKSPYAKRLERGEQIDFFKFYLAPEQMSMTAPDSLKHLTITGSAVNRLHGELKEMLKENDGKFAALQKEFMALPEEKRKDKSVFESFVAREKALMNESFEVHLAFANKHPESYLSVISLAHIAAQPGMAAKAEVVYGKLPAKLRESPMGKSIPVLIASQKNVQLGKTAPDFVQKTADGKDIKLSDFRGKYLLLDFWASWCGPCREENPNLVTAYRKYENKGFQILGVSLDAPAQKNAWLTAIEKDQLNWPQVSDLKGWNNAAAKLYGIRAIPANFLIDPSGRIIARDLRGKDLSEKLESIFQ